MNELKHIKDEEIVSNVVGGNKEMFSEIIKRYQDKLLRYANYLIGDQDEASDAVQETFIKAYVNLNGFYKNKKFSSWIYRIAHNESVNIINKGKKRVPLFDSFKEVDSVNVEDGFIKKELIKDAQQCLKNMPLIYGEVLTLYYLEEKSYEEISDILRVPVGTVGTRINRAKFIMKKLCQKK